MTSNKKVDIGLDISTSIVGVCVLDSETGSLVKLAPIKLTSTKLEDQYDKADVVEKFLQEELGEYDINRIFVEEAHKKFTSGFSSAHTLFSLATFNGIVCHICYTKLGKKAIKVGVRTARKVLGIKIDTKDKSETNKEKVFKMVVALQPSFPWMKHIAKTGKKKGQEVYDQCNYDMADAWIIARAGQLLNKKP